MNIKLIVLSPITAIYNFQLNIRKMNIRSELKRVIIGQVALIFSTPILGMSAVTLMSISNLLFILIVMSIIGDLKRETFQKIIDHTVSSLQNKSEM